VWTQGLNVNPYTNGRTRMVGIAYTTAADLEFRKGGSVTGA